MLSLILISESLIISFPDIMLQMHICYPDLGVSDIHPKSVQVKAIIRLFSVPKFCIHSGNLWCLAKFVISN